MRIVVVGLPLFSKRLAENLKEFDKGNSYVFLNTYYNKWDKLKALYHIPRANIVFSINGSIQKSKVFDLALKNKIPLIMNWVGTDVLRAIKSFNLKQYNREYIEKAIHYCEVDWIREELQPIGINAEIVNFATFDKQFPKVKPASDRLNVLAYIPEVRSDFYGMHEFITLARNNPDVDFTIAGTKGTDYAPLPQNVDAKGWIENMDEVFNNATVCVRYLEHDGLSNFILESLARGKQVIYKYNYPNCLHAANEGELQKRLEELKAEHAQGKDLTNEAGMNFIKIEFSKEKILGNLVTRFKEINERK